VRSIKRSLTAATAAVLATGVLAACGAAEPAGQSGGGGQTAAGGGPARSLVFVQGVAGDEFYITMQCGIQEAARAANLTVDVQGPEKFDPTLQKPIVDSVVARRPAALLVAPTDVTAMQAPLKAAADAGIKVVLVDTTLDDPSVAVSQVASDNEGGGRAAFDAVKQLAPGGGKVLVISVKPGISTTDARTKGFQDAVAADPSFQYLGVQYSNNEPAEAARLVTAALQKDPDIVGIFATNLFSAEGSATGVRQAGKQEQVKIIGFDAGPAQVEALKEGTVQALIAQQPAKIGQDGVAQAVAALDGQPVQQRIQTGFTIITQQNVDGDGRDALYKSTC
jgi:ribose transport system substrate-binding protein